MSEHDRNNQDDSGDDPRRPDFETFEDGFDETLTIPTGWLRWICRIRLIHAWLLLATLLGVFMVRAGSNLNVTNLIGGLGTILLTGVIVAYVERNGSSKNEANQETPQSRNDRRGA